MLKLTKIRRECLRPFKTIAKVLRGERCVRPHAMTNRAFKVWWFFNRVNTNIPKQLRFMEDYFVKNCLNEYSSSVWNYFNVLSINRIKNHGFSNFKQTVAKNYFLWKVSLDHPYALKMKELVKNPQVFLEEEELHRKHSFFSQEESKEYNLITLFFINYLIDLGYGHYLQRLEEPLIGNPTYNLYQGRRISQDICNALLEYIAVAQHCTIDDTKTVIEIGAGSGRTASCFLQLHPNLKYIIVDMPPALYISQRYLSEVFCDRSIMHFRPFSAFHEIASLFERSQIIFMTPDQLKLLPDRVADLFLAINCLHEMRFERVQDYLQEADRLASYCYYKCWQTAYLEYDNHARYSQFSYPIPAHWNMIFNQTTTIPSDFFHALYQTHGSHPTKIPVASQVFS